MSAIAPPTAAPATANRAPPPPPSRNTSAASAPSATRTASSCRRCATLEAIPLYTPTAASTSASAPNAVNTVAPISQERDWVSTSSPSRVTITYEAPGISFCNRRRRGSIAPRGAPATPLLVPLRGRQVGVEVLRLGTKASRVNVLGDPDHITARRRLCRNADAHAPVQRVLARPQRSEEHTSELQSH